jgi:hypothetical protein
VRGRTCFAKESLADIGVSGEVRRKRLDRNRAVEIQIPCEIDDAHSTSPDLTLDVVLANESSSKRGEVGHCGIRSRESVTGNPEPRTGQLRSQKTG